MNIRHFSILSILLLALATLQACTMAKISGKSSKPLLLNGPNTQSEIVSSMDETQLKAFDYTGAIDVYGVISDIVANSEADAITNITINIKSDPATFFINVFTLGIANAYKVNITGDLVTLPKGLAGIEEMEMDKETLTNIHPDPDKETTTLHFNGFVTP